jgi:hypothetical protein
MRKLPMRIARGIVRVQPPPETIQVNTAGDGPEAVSGTVLKGSLMIRKPTPW